MEEGKDDPDFGGLPPKPPDKQRHDKFRVQLEQQIQNRERQLASCVSLDVSKRLDELRRTRDGLRDLHKQADERIQAMAPRITQTRHAMFKLRDKLKYRTEEQVDDAVRRLETQIQTRHFKLREEEKIVREIHELKKSKRALREYDAKKKDLEGLGKEQQALRQERDRLYGLIDKNVREEDRLLNEAASSAATVDMLKEELEELKDRLSREVQNYQEQQERWNSWQHGLAVRRRDSRRKQRNDSQPQPSDPPQPAPAPGQQQQQRYLPDPYRLELNTCLQLINYMHRLSHTPTPGVTPATPSPGTLHPPSASGGASLLSPRTPVVDPDGGPTMFVLRKKDEPETPSGSAGRGKRRRDKRTSQRVRPLTHTSEIFHQFCLLELTPPSTTKEVPTAIEQLKAKQKYYQMCALRERQEGAYGRSPAASERQPTISDPPPASSPSASVPSVSQLTLRLRPSLSLIDDFPPPPPPSGELVTLHSIGLTLPYELTVAPPTSLSHHASAPEQPPSCPSSRDSGVPSAPPSAEAVEPSHNPFAEALQSRLQSTDAGAIQRSPQPLEVPAVTR